jgi:ankyrin repeat protein
VTGYFDIVQILVEREEAIPSDSFLPVDKPKKPADPNIRNKDGLTPAHCASTIEIYRYLKYRGRNLEVVC